MSYLYIYIYIYIYLIIDAIYYFIFYLIIVFIIDIQFWSIINYNIYTHYNAKSISVEELDWSAERQVLIPAEHLWCDFKYRPWAKNSSPNTNDLYIHYNGQKYWDTPFFTREKGTNKLWQQRN